VTYFMRPVNKIPKPKKPHGLPDTEPEPHEPKPKERRRG
jgi:hypothetical protein